MFIWISFSVWIPIRDHITTRSDGAINGESCTFNITWRRRERKKREKLVYFTKGNLPSVYVSQTRKLCTLQCQMRWYNQAHWHRVDNLLLAIPVNPIPTGKIECQKLVISQKGFRNHIKEFIMYDRKLHKVFWWILLIGKIVSSFVAFSRIMVDEIEVIIKGIVLFGGVSNIRGSPVQGPTDQTRKTEDQAHFPM